MSVPPLPNPTASPASMEEVQQVRRAQAPHSYGSGAKRLNVPPQSPSSPKSFYTKQLGGLTTSATYVLARVRRDPGLGAFRDDPADEVAGHRRTRTR